MTTKLTGSCDKRFEPLKAMLEANIESGAECGLSFVIDIDGKNVLDVYGGYRDAARTKPWEKDTIVNVWSTTKTIMNLAALVLADRGQLDLDAPVAKYWPEFAQNGKEKVLVRHIMSHTSGVSGWAAPFTKEEFYDWNKNTAHLAAQPPWWEPGKGLGYHAISQGFLVGEVIRRITGKTLKQFVDTEIAKPLGADFQIGDREADWPRTAELIPPPPLPFDVSVLPKDSVAYKMLTGYPLDASEGNTAAWRHADIGAANGHGNAHSVAKIMSAIALGGSSHGVKLLSPKTIERIFEEQIHAVDQFHGLDLRWGLGYCLTDPNGGVPFLPNGKICFWGGWGGSLIIMDLDRRMTISYMMNKMGAGILGSEHSAAYAKAIFAAV